jgi:4-hydroxybenzoate polyprenyltransferase
MDSSGNFRYRANSIQSGTDNVVFNFSRRGSMISPPAIPTFELISPSASLQSQRKILRSGPEAIALLRPTFSKVVGVSKTFLGQAQWLLHVIYLFTKTDIHNLVVPGCTLSGVIHAIYGHSFLGAVISMGKTFIWGYLGLLVIDITNQLMGQAEDRANKPFRPLVSGLISERDAMRLAVFSSISFVLVAHWQGVLWSALSFVAATSMYNFTGLDRHWIGKNFCNAWGYSCFFSAGGWISYMDLTRSGEISGAVATRMALDVQCLILFHLFTIFSSISIQDLRDVDGDLASMRLTQNMDWGEPWTRFSIVFAMISCTCTGAFGAWRFFGQQVLFVFRFIPEVSPWSGFPVWTITSVSYLAVIALLVLIMGYRVYRDCPTYQIVQLDPEDEDEERPIVLVSELLNFKKTAARFGISVPVVNPASGDKAEDGRKQRDSEVNYAEDLVLQVKREQYERDDVSFKIYILWLYLLIFTAVI